jgi:hypothetical protein
VSFGAEMRLAAGEVRLAAAADPSLATCAAGRDCSECGAVTCAVAHLEARPSSARGVGNCHGRLA